MSVLVVDDEPDARRLMQLILQNGGYGNVETADSAEAAFDLLRLTNPAAGPPAVDLIVMDFAMPEMDGIEATRRIKAAEHLRDIPIIFVTGRTELETLERAFEAGVLEYVTKPFNNVELLARVRTALNLKHELDQRRSQEAELRSVTDRLREANENLQRLSSLDGLTGIANRRRFDEVFHAEWRRSARSGGWLSTIMIDIDNFKSFNDHFGHLRGDEALRLVASTLQSNLLRSSDLVARYGGEEFVVIMPETDLKGSLAVAERLREAIEGLMIKHPGRRGGRLTISLGVASVVPPPGSTAEGLLGDADQALYQAKQEGRNRVRSRPGVV